MPTLDELIELSGHGDPGEVAARLKLALASATAAEVRELVAAVEGGTLARSHVRRIWPAIAARWAEVDVEAALVHASSIDHRWMRRTLIRPALVALAETDPQRAAELLAEIPESENRVDLAREIAPALVRADPELALRVARRHAADLFSWEVSLVFAHWAKDDLAAAKAYLPEVKSAEERVHAVRAITSAMVLDDPDAALAWGKTLGSPSEQVAAVGAVVRHLASVDPNRAISVIEAIPHDAQRAGVMSTFVLAFVEADSDAALRWLGSLENKTERVRLLGVAGRQVGENRPAEAVDLVLEFGPRDTFRPMIEAAIENLAPGEFASAATRLHTLQDGQFKQSAIADLVERWTASDPEAALGFVSVHLDDGSYRQALGSGVRTWAHRDGERAARWVASLEPSRQGDAMGVALSAWAHDDPEAAAAFMFSLGNDEIVAGSASALTAAWVRNDVDKALAFARRLPDDARAPALAAAVGIISQWDTSTAVAVFENDLLSAADTKQATQTAAHLVSAWAQWDPGAAARWAGTLPENVGGDALNSAVRRWVGTDPAAVSEWLVDVTAGAARDHATTHLVGAITHSDPEGAFVWAASASDAATRFGLIAGVAKQWATQDETAAVDAALATDLTDAQKTEVLGGFAE